MRKKLLLFLLILIWLPFCVEAVTIDGIQYELGWNEETHEYDHAYVYGYEGELTDVIILDKIVIDGEEYAVTSIGEYAFSNCSLTSIIIPSSVTTIGEYAFHLCNLTTVILLGSEITIEDYAFYCSFIRKLAYPKSMGLQDTSWASVAYAYNPEEVLIENNFIYSKDRKTLFFTPYILSDDNNFRLPETLERIGKEAFAFSSIDTLYIPASLRYIGEDAFKDCKIERVVFEDWNQWFNNITLANLWSNPYVPKIRKDPSGIYDQPELYEGDTRLMEFELPYDLTRIPDYVLVGLNFNFRDEVEIPYGVKRIGAYAFYNNKELYHVFLNDALEEIGEHAFDGCELLENQTLPASLRKIEDAAYKDCVSLTEVVLPENLSSLGKNVFEGCQNIERAVLVADIDYIPDFAFNECRALNKLYLPLRLKSIGNSAFGTCLALDEITFPSTLESIGESAFGCPYGWRGGLTSVNIPDNVTTLGPNAFSFQNIQSLVLGKGLKTISQGAFMGNWIKSISFSEGLEKIEEGAFANNHNDYFSTDFISSVILPSTLKEIEKDAFSWTPIGELVIPDGVVSLPSGSCGRPVLLTVGKDVKTIDANALIFDRLITFRLKATMPPTLNESFPITDEENDQLTLVVNQGRKDRYTTNARWKQIDNIIEEESTDVTVYLDGTYTMAEEIRMQSGLMPSRVSKLKVVGPLSEDDLRVMRENMVSLRSLDLSEVTNVAAIPDGQFKGSLLNEIILPAGIERIGNESFANSRLLTMDALPETITSIGDRAFEGCIRVTFSRMPESLTALGEGAFSGCSAIKEMAFTNQFSGSLPSYTFQDCTQLERVDLSTTEIQSIEQEAFRGCYELDEIILPETLTSISYAAFYGTAIRDISFLPANVSEIGEQTFSNCRRLVAATLPQRMTSVSSNIFSGCGRLLTVSMPAGILSVGRDLVNGDKKLSNISCAATDAPEAETGAFDNIRLRYVSLTVPTLSFRTYLSAPQWGKFETIQNRISTSIGHKVEVTNVAEDEYQDMLEEDRLEELQETSTQAPQEEEQPENMRRRAARRAAARAVTNRSFAALFDGAQIQTGDEGSGTRIFINPEEGVNVTSVKFNGEEMLDKMEGNSLLLPAGSKGELVISTDANVDTGIGEVIYDETTAPIYTLTGTMVGRGHADLSNLQPGIYIFCGRKITVK